MQLTSGLQSRMTCKISEEFIKRQLFWSRNTPTNRRFLTRVRRTGQSWSSWANMTPDLILKPPLELAVLVENWLTSSCFPLQETHNGEVSFADVSTNSSYLMEAMKNMSSEAYQQMQDLAQTEACFIMICI